MSDIVDLDAERKARRGPQPDAEHVVTDEHGARWYRFTCSYKNPDEDGGESVFDIWARDHAHAERKMMALRASARVDGQVYESGWIPL